MHFPKVEEDVLTAIQFEQTNSKVFCPWQSHVGWQRGWYCRRLAFNSLLIILANWKLIIKKICDVKPNCFLPKPKIDSTLLFFSPKKNFLEIKNPKNLEMITRIFFNHRRKMIKKPYNKLFSGDLKVRDKLKIDLNLRPQNLNFNTYYNLTREYENLWY